MAKVAFNKMKASFSSKIGLKFKGKTSVLHLVYNFVRC
jgi:hypothetical protein